MKVVIIGGVAGGATAAARLRRLDENAEIVMLEKTGYVSYANCGLPYYIGDVITDKKKLTLQTPESFRKRFNVDARVLHEAVSIDRAGHKIRVRNLADGSEYEESYDKLILAPGAKALRPEIPGINSSRVFVLKTVEDTFALHDFTDELDSEMEKSVEHGRILIMGGGFIGLETAENLRDRGFNVTVVQRGAQVMPSFDADMARLIEKELVTSGIDLRLRAEVTELKETGAGIIAHLSTGDTVTASAALCTIGVTPESYLAKDAGLALGVRGSIQVDEHMRTNDPDIYAVGDAVEVTRFGTGQKGVIPLAGPANKQGRIAADSICGLDHSFNGSQGTSVMKIFGLTAASTGLNEKLATAAGIDFDSVVLIPPSHASYYPGASGITLKVLFEKNAGRIIGAQAIGKEGADKRIDVLATAIRANMTADDIAELDLAYAPPYSSAKDPVNMAGYMIQNLIEGHIHQVKWETVLEDMRLGKEEDGSRTILLDVRTDSEYERGHIEGAVHIPVDELRDCLDELDKDALYNVHCQTGLRSYIACRILNAHGIDCANVSGGYGFFSSTHVENAGPCGAKLN